MLRSLKVASTLYCTLEALRCGGCHARGSHARGSHTRGSAGRPGPGAFL